MPKRPEQLGDSHREGYRKFAKRLLRRLRRRLRKVMEMPPKDSKLTRGWD